MVLPAPLTFEWDKGNSEKNWLKHRIRNSDAEEVFFDKQKRIAKDVFHSGKEKRFILLGKTKKETVLSIVFTIRRNKIRIISARKINKKEARLYEQ